MCSGDMTERIREAAAFLKGKIRRTPLEPSPKLSAMLGMPVWVKLELLQVTGSFKIRGAWFRLAQLSETERARGILTCSAGNHGKGVAYAAKALGVGAVICVPKSVDRAKYEGMVALGAEVRVSEYPGYDDTEIWAREQAKAEGKPFISPFDEVDVMAGNGGTLAVEILEDAPEAGTFIVPVGGGGLAAGLAFHVKEKLARAVVIGCQHELSPGLKMSLEAGRAITRLPAIDTVAGGVEGGIGELPFEILRTRIDDVALVSEREIYTGMRWMMEQHQYLIEPSAAVTIAACVAGKVPKITSPAVVVISGRNVSLDVLRRVLDAV
jgi:threonine dehydratase